MMAEPRGMSSAGSREADVVREAGEGSGHDQPHETSVDFEGCDEPRGNGHDDRGEEHERRIVAEGMGVEFRVR